MEVIKELEFTVELPDNIVIPCPERKFMQIRAKNCLGCEHYKGLQHNPSEPQEYVERAFFVICGRPISRRMQRIL